MVYTNKNPPDLKKYCASDKLSTEEGRLLYKHAYEFIYEQYRRLLLLGFSKDQAEDILPSGILSQKKGLLMNNNDILIRRVHPDAQIPSYATEGSVGFDLHSCDTYKVYSKSYCEVRTGLVIKPPDGYSINIYPRSSTFKRYSLIMPISVGIVDYDYCGEDDEIKMMFYNMGVKDVVLETGVRLAQAVLVRANKFEIRESKESFATKSRGGNGSTGV